MPRYLTRTLNMARFLSRQFFLHGRDAFQAELDTCVSFLVEQFAPRPAELTTHLDALLDSLLHGFGDGNPDRITRWKAELAGGWRGEVPPERRLRAFRADIAALLRRMEDDLASEGLGERVVQHIKTCPDPTLRRLTLESLADAFGYSRTHFAERFRGERGITVHDALTHEKMHRAFRLLTEGDPPPTVRVLTERLGFSDPVYFSRVFRKIYGRLPSQIRRG